MQYRITTTGKIPRMIKNAINTYSLVLDILQSLYRVSFSFLQFACFIFPISMSTIHRYHSPCRNRPLRVRDPWGDAPATKSSGWPRPKAEPRSGRKGPREHAERDAPVAKRPGWVSKANCEAAARPRASAEKCRNRRKTCFEGRAKRGDSRACETERKPATPSRKLSLRK